MDKNDRILFDEINAQLTSSNYLPITEAEFEHYKQLMYIIPNGAEPRSLAEMIADDAKMLQDNQELLNVIHICNSRLADVGQNPLTNEECSIIRLGVLRDNQGFLKKYSLSGIVDYIQRMREEAKVKHVQKHPKTFTSFSGEDAIVVVGTKAVAEVQEIKFIEDLTRNTGGGKVEVSFNDPHPVKGIIQYAVFDDEPKLIRQIQNEGFKAPLSVVYADECGNRSVDRFIDVQFLEREQGVSIDDVLQGGIVRFSAFMVRRYQLPKDMQITMDDGTINPDVHRAEALIKED